MLRWPSRAVASPLPHVSRRGVHTSTTSLQQPEKAWGKVFQGNHQATGPQTYSHRVARRERGAESRLSTLPHARLAARPATTYEQRVCVCRGKCSSLQLKLATFSPYISPYSQRPTRHTHPNDRPHMHTTPHGTRTRSTLLSLTRWAQPLVRALSRSCSWSGAPPLCRALGYLQGSSAGQRPAQAKTRRHTRPHARCTHRSPPRPRIRGSAPIT